MFRKQYENFKPQKQDFFKNRQGAFRNLPQKKNSTARFLSQPPRQREAGNGAEDKSTAGGNREK